MANTIHVLVHRHPDCPNEIRVCGQPGGWRTHIIEIDQGSEYNGHPANREEAARAYRQVLTLRREVAGLHHRTSVRRYTEDWAAEMEGTCRKFLDDNAMAEIEAAENRK